MKSCHHSWLVILMLNVLNFSFLPDYRVMAIRTNLWNKEMQSYLFISSWQSQYSSLQISNYCVHIFLFIQKKKTYISSLRSEEVVPSAPVKFNSFLASGTEKATQCVCPLAPLTVSNSPHLSPPRGWSGTHGIRTKSSGKDLGKRWCLINRNKKFSYQQFGLKSASIS